MSLGRSLSGALLSLGVAMIPVQAAAQAPVTSEHGAHASAPRQPDPSDSLLSAPTLNQSLFERAVLARNPSLGAMRAAWRSAEAQADAAGAWDDPMVEVM